MALQLLLTHFELLLSEGLICSSLDSLSLAWIGALEKLRKIS